MADASHASSCAASSTLLDTGGGTRAALDVLGDAPFYTVNGDAFWLNGPSRALTRLAAAFDPDRVDAVLLVYRTAQVRAEVGFGDFMLDKWGAPRRREEREVVPYLYAGVQVISPALFAGAPDGPFNEPAVEAARHGGRSLAGSGA